MKKHKLHFGKLPFDWTTAKNITRSISNNKVRLLFWCGCCLGLRFNNLVKLTKSQILTDFFLVKAKRNKTIPVYIPSYFRKSFKDFNINLDEFDEQLFLSDHGNYLSQSYMAKCIKRACQEIGIPKHLIINYSTHSMRKTFGRHYIEMNASDPLVIQSLVTLFGHDSEEYTRRYLGIDHDHIRENMKNFK